MDIYDVLTDKKGGHVLRLERSRCNESYEGRLWHERQEGVREVMYRRRF